MGIVDEADEVVATAVGVALAEELALTVGVLTAIDDGWVDDEVATLGVGVAVPSPEAQALSSRGATRTRGRTRMARVEWLMTSP